MVKCSRVFGAALCALLVVVSSASAASPWRVKPAPSPDAVNYLVGASALSGSDVWAVGSHTSATNCPCVVYPLAEHWDGHSWTAISPDGVDGAGSTRLNGVARIPGSSDVWAVGDTYDNTLVHPVAYRFHAGTWTQVPLPDLGTGSSGTLSAVVTRGGGDAWAVGSYATPSGGTHPLALHWDGAAWQRVDTSALASGGELRGGAYVSGRTLYAVGDTTSFGQPYQPLMLKLTPAKAKLQPSPMAAPDAMLSAITAVPGSTEMWATGVNNSTGMTVYLHLVGGVWSVQSQVAGGAGASLAAIGPNDVWAAGGGAAHWNGTSWTPETVSGGDFDYAEAITAAPNGKSLWAVGESGSGSSVTALVAKRTL